MWPRNLRENETIVCALYLCCLQSLIQIVIASKRNFFRRTRLGGSVGHAPSGEQVVSAPFTLLQCIEWKSCLFVCLYVPLKWMVTRLHPRDWKATEPHKCSCSQHTIEYYRRAVFLHLHGPTTWAFSGRFGYGQSVHSSALLFIHFSLFHNGQTAVKW